MSQWKRRTAGVLLAAAIGAILLFGTAAIAETVLWTNPTMYMDNTVIPAAKAAQLSTQIQYRTGATWIDYATVYNGASGYTGASYVTPGGTTSYWRARSISVADNNSTSPWSTEFPFARAFQAPVVPSGLSVQ